jgi:hypothetical protein
VASSLVVCGARPASSSQHGEHELALPYIFGDARALAGLIEERLPFSAAAVEVEPDEAETVRRDGHRSLAHEPVEPARVRCGQRVPARA